jgi:replicative DNA helicase
MSLEEAKALHKAYKVASQHMYHREATNENTLEEILAMGREVKGNHPANRLLIVIDYLQIMPTPPRLRDDKQRVDYLVTGLRQLARTLDAPVVAISSLRKGGWDTKGSLGMEELKESASLGYGADVVGILESGDSLLTKIANAPNLSSADKKALEEARKRYTTDERLASTFSVLRIIKNRNGERASLLYHYIRAYNEFIPIEREGKAGGGKLNWINVNGD